MRSRFILIPLILNCFALFSAPNHQEKALEAYLDSVLHINDLEYDVLKSELIHYSKANYRNLKSVEEIVLFFTTKINPKTKRFSNEFLFELKHLKLLSYYTHPVVNDLKKINYDLIKSNDLWDKPELLTKLYIFLHEVSYWKLDVYRPSLLGAKLQDLYESTDNKKFLNKLVIFTLVEKIYNSNKFVNRGLVCESIHHNIKVVNSKKLNFENTAIQAPQGTFQPPVFPGGDALLNRFIQDNFEYPQEAFEQKINGDVEVNFLINPNGKVEKITIVSSDNELLSKETIRLIQSLPFWKPGQYNDKVVNTSMTIPFQFRIEHKMPASLNLLSDCIITDY